MLIIKGYDCWLKGRFTKAPKVGKKVSPSVQGKKFKVKVFEPSLREIINIHPWFINE